MCASFRRQRGGRGSSNFDITLLTGETSLISGSDLLGHYRSARHLGTVNTVSLPGGFRTSLTWSFRPFVDSDRCGRIAHRSRVRQPLVRAQPGLLLSIAPAVHPTVDCGQRPPQIHDESPQSDLRTCRRHQLGGVKRCLVVLCARQNGERLSQNRSRNGSILCVPDARESVAATLKKFTTHLEAYRPLIRTVSRYEFVSWRPRSASFERRNRGSSESSTEARKCLWERPSSVFPPHKRGGAGQRLVASEVVELNSCRKQFTDKTTAALYRKWVAGTATDREVISSFATSVTPSVGVFRAEKWGDSLSVFICGNPESSENWNQELCEAVSPQFSPEIHPRRPARPNVFKCLASYGAQKSTGTKHVLGR